MKKILAIIIACVCLFSVAYAGEEVSNTQSIPEEKIGKQTVPAEELLDPNRYINLWIDYGEDGYIFIGEIITIHATIVGFDAVPYTIQWQESSNGSEGWVDIPGATNDSIDIFLTQENCTHYWRVMVNYPDEIEINE